ncbi:MAG TPA: hypothetical protein PK079_22195 [Leptospiraceae bacterium]|nr:hypothetical protein [Leptospiraceae bacterium]HMY34434.1 hypothetical protein [Leptospiraceae bacterium]HMZ66888.1 hypothetical protein [Leptospiraceae bacterium]HNA09532.1 hypothetical protein [Leptospiraceae bacterium]HNC58606.1 hypothetical protein [Leptospiraceae bacterium]
MESEKEYSVVNGLYSDKERVTGLNPLIQDLLNKYFALTITEIYK